MFPSITFSLGVSPQQNFQNQKQVKKVSAKARAKANHYPAQKTIWGGRLGPQGPGPPKLFLGFGLTGLVIRMGPWGIIQECCMMHLVICLTSYRSFRSLIVYTVLCLLLMAVAYLYLLFVCSLVCSCLRAFAHAFIQPFVHAFIHDPVYF